MGPPIISIGTSASVAPVDERFRQDADLFSYLLWVLSLPAGLAHHTTRRMICIGNQKLLYEAFPSHPDRLDEYCRHVCLEAAPRVQREESHQCFYFPACHICQSHVSLPVGAVH